MINEFFEIAANLKNVPRKGWIDKLGINSPESVADHCYSTTLMAMVFSDLQKLDTKKVIKISLLHDLAESITGDLTPDDISKHEKKELEEKTIGQILNNLPEFLSKEYSILWKEYQDNQTNESKLVHEVDKLEMALQAKIYSDQGQSKEKLQSFFDSANQDIQNEELKKIFQQIFNTT